jgi:alkanesulfonate monooxygenase
MKIGLQLYEFDWSGSPNTINSKITEIAKTAEKMGFSSIWLMDHLYQIGDGFGDHPSEPMLEGYTTLSFLAGKTNKISLGLMVTGNVNRPPGMLIKVVTTLDVLSEGRAYLGIGTGWYEAEVRGLGIHFPSTRQERIVRLKETLQIAQQMWKGNESPFKGKFYYLENPICSPQPISKPHPPILIGFEKERVMPKIAAKYANAINLHLGIGWEGFPDRKVMKDWYKDRRNRITRKLTILKACCENIKRNYDEIEKTVLGTIKLGSDAMTSTQIVELCHELADMGIHHIIFNMPNAHEIEPLNIIGKDIISAVNTL